MNKKIKSPKVSGQAKNLKVLLQTKEQKLIEAAELAAESTDDYLAIKEFLTRRINNMQLTQRQQQRLEKYEFIYNQLVSGKYTETEVLDMVSVRYGLEKAMCRSYIIDAKDIFSTSFNINKAFELKVQLDLNRVEMQKASMRGDLKAYAMLEKNRISIAKLLPDPEEESHEDYEGHVIVPVFDPSLLGINPINKHDVARLLEDIQKEYGGNFGLKEPEDAEADVLNEETEQEDEE